MDAAIEATNALKPLSFFGALFALLLWERIRPFRQTGIALKPRWLVNGKLTLINMLASALIPITLVSVAIFAQAHDVGLIHLMNVPIVPAVIVSILLRALISYVAHYLAHKVPLFWNFHRVHHLDPDIDVTTTTRFHPFEIVLILIIGIPVTLAAGLDPLVLALYDLIKAPVNALSHANVRLPRLVESWGKYLIVTSLLHRVHHSSDQRYTDSNFSDLIPIWDWVFGTLRMIPVEDQRTMELGLDTPWHPSHEKLSWLLWPRKPVKDSPPTDAIRALGPGDEPGRMVNEER